MQRPRFTIVPQSTALTVILACVYLLSYAPVYRYSPAADAPGASALRCVFGPVECVIDSTPLRKPLLVWSDWWGVRRNIEWDIYMREGSFDELDPLTPFRANRALPADPGNVPLFTY
jgi:hypothetical protein